MAAERSREATRSGDIARNKRGDPFLNLFGAMGSQGQRQIQSFVDLRCEPFEGSA